MLSNGALLNAAEEAGFEVLLTSRCCSQQNRAYATSRTCVQGASPSWL
jgi:hypothetical protein